MLSEKQLTILPYLLGISLLFFFITSSYHAFHLTKSLANVYLFQDADYIGISDILLSIYRGEGFTSSYYSTSGEGSYLHHHFAPGILILTPFISWIPYKLGLAVAVFFIYQLATILWIFWGYRISKHHLKEKGIKFLTFWVLLTNQLYLYRIGSSFHFEVLVLLYGFFFFYIWEQRKMKPIVGSHFFWTYVCILFFATILYLSLKEDIGFYLLLFFLPTILIQFYKIWENRTKTRKADSEQASNIQDPITFRLLLLIVSIIFLWLGFVFFIYPMFGDAQGSIVWTHILRQEYHSAFKQVTGAKKSFLIFLEIVVSGGLGILQILPEVIGIGLVYTTHIFSTRPWHHEVYTYYSYTLMPLVLYSGILWLQSEKKMTLSFAFLILTCLFWKNSLDPNFPLNTNIESPWKNLSVQKEIQSDLKEVNLFLLSTHSEPIFGEPKENKNPDILKNTIVPSDLKENSNRIFVFTQYNLSFFITDKTKTYPLEQIKNSFSICKKANLCYVVLAPEFTDEILWPKPRILEYKKELENQKGVFVWEGKQIEVWKLPQTN